MNRVGYRSESRDQVLGEPVKRAPRLTLEELEFLRTEIYSSLCCGADHPLFERVYQKLHVIIAFRGGKVFKREFPAGPNP